MLEILLSSHFNSGVIAYHRNFLFCNSTDLVYVFKQIVLMSTIPSWTYALLHCWLIFGIAYALIVIAY